MLSSTRHHHSFPLRRNTVKKLITYLFIFAIALNLLTPGASSYAAEKVFIRIQTSTLGGVWFPVASGMSAIINAKVPGVLVTATTGHGVRNIRRIETGKDLMGFTISAAAAAAKAGAGPFKKVGKVKHVMSFASMYPSPIQLVTPADAGIKKVPDLIGKRLIPHKRGGPLELAVRRILGEYGINYKKITAAGGRINHVGYPEMVIAYKDRQVDMMALMLPVPAPPVLNMQTSRRVSILGLDESVVDKLVKKFPGYNKEKIPAGSYKGTTSDAWAIGVSHMVVIRDSVSNELAYKMAKAVFGNLKVLKKFHPVLKRHLSVKSAAKNLPLPLHPGAARYYKEKGAL